MGVLLSAKPYEMNRARRAEDLIGLADNLEIKMRVLGKVPMIYP